VRANSDEAIITPSPINIDSAVDCRAQNNTFMVISVITEELNTPGCVRCHQLIGEL
jgi:hypothetical protein